MNILFVAHTLPWPENSGARMRLANVLRGLARLGNVDLFALTNRNGLDTCTVPSGAPVRRVEILSKPRSNFSPMRRLVWLGRGGLPSDFVGRDYSQVRSKYAAWAADKYDLAWLSRVESYVALKGYINAPTIVDIDDLEDQKISTRLMTMDRPRGSARHVVARVQGARNMRLWRRLHMEIADAVGAMVVCSEIDCRRLGVPNAVVIPNGYDYQQRPVGRTLVGVRPVISFPGFHSYPPNVDAAHYLVKRIVPLMRARVPEVQIRLVGHADERVLRLQDAPRVVVTGFVDDIATELAIADVIAVPVRFGSGTRIKILEAFAHRIPVVSTALGAEGIDAVHGREILIADTAETFADACVKLLIDAGSRPAIVEAAHTLFMEKYRWEHIHERIASVGAWVAAMPTIRNGHPVGRGMAEEAG